MEPKMIAVACLVCTHPVYDNEEWHAVSSSVQGEGLAHDACLRSLKRSAPEPL